MSLNAPVDAADRESQKSLALRSFQESDKRITDVVLISSFVSVFDLGTQKGDWRRANIEGFLFVTKCQDDTAKPSTTYVVVCSGNHSTQSR